MGYAIQSLLRTTNEVGFKGPRRARIVYYPPYSFLIAERIAERKGPRLVLLAGSDYEADMPSVSEQRAAESDSLSIRSYHKVSLNLSEFLQYIWYLS